MQPVLNIERGSLSWPRELDSIAAPPEELWARGNLPLLQGERRVAIVGTRSPTPYGEGQARRFARVLAERGVVIVSGLARGIDDAAHQAALDAGGGTLAVLGCGVDRPWPAGVLAERMATEGLLLSELPPGTPPRRHHFPLRNRLISGLSHAVVVVEAAYASGSLITARWAADQGRSVFALPGRVDHPMARGCHRLLREGATLLEDPEELFEELGLATGSTPGGARAAPERSTLQRALLAGLQGESRSAEELAEACAQRLEQVLAALVELELDGEVVRGPGGIYRLG